MHKTIFSGVNVVTKIFMTFFLITGFMMLPAASPDAGADEELKLVSATYLPPVYKGIFPAIPKFVEDVNKHGKGSVQIDLYHSGTLLKAKELLSGVQAGTADIIFQTDAYISGTYPILGAVQLPLLYNSEAERYEKNRLGTPTSDFLRKKLKEKGMALLAIGNVPTEYIWTVKKPVRTPGDMNGLRMRVSGKIDSKTATTFGSSPVRMPSAEAYMALKRGLVDGIMAYSGTIAGRRLDEILKYCTVGSFGNMHVLILTTQKRWESWPENVRKIMMEAARKYETNMYETTTKYTKNLFETRFKNIEVINLNNKEKDDFRNCLSQTYSWWIDTVGKSEGEEALKIVRAK
ncbi:MAG: TRAP transporter substrate-binding protein DctP [Desulfosarcina sp.]|nr:TRAP transporter substrate-binding protein DctP [Desulfobacterales bacterium]